MFKDYNDLLDLLSSQELKLKNIKSHITIDWSPAFYSSKKHLDFWKNSQGLELVNLVYLAGLDWNFELVPHFIEEHMINLASKSLKNKPYIINIKKPTVEIMNIDKPGPKEVMYINSILEQIVKHKLNISVVEFAERSFNHYYERVSEEYITPAIDKLKTTINNKIRELKSRLSKLEFKLYKGLNTYKIHKLRSSIPLNPNIICNFRNNPEGLTNILRVFSVDKSKELYYDQNEKRKRIINFCSFMSDIVKIYYTQVEASAIQRCLKIILGIVNHPCGLDIKNTSMTSSKLRVMGYLVSEFAVMCSRDTNITVCEEITELPIVKGEVNFPDISKHVYNVLLYKPSLESIRKICKSNYKLIF